MRCLIYLKNQVKFVIILIGIAWRNTNARKMIGESGMSNIMKSALNPKKSTIWIIIMAVAACIITALCLIINPAEMKITSIKDTENFSGIFDDVQKIKVVTRESRQYIVTNPERLRYIVSNLRDVRLARAPVSQNRDDDRGRSNSITINGAYTLYFNYEFTELWISFGTNATLSYSVLNPETAEAAFESREVRELKEKYPQYFNLDTKNGLIVYVRLSNTRPYSFILLSGNDNRKSVGEILDMTPASLEEIRTIIETYSVSSDNIYIFAAPEPDVEYIDGSFRETIGEMLLPMGFSAYYESDPAYEGPIYDTAAFDVDGDGKKEKCSLGYGSTSGVFSFSFTAWDESSEDSSMPKYYCDFRTPYYSNISFVTCEDGVTRIRGWSGSDDKVTKEYLFDIVFRDAGIALYTYSKTIYGEIIENPVYD